MISSMRRDAENDTFIKGFNSVVEFYFKENHY